MPTFDKKEPISNPKQIKPLLEGEAAAQTMNEAQKAIKRDDKAGGKKDETNPAEEYF